MLKNTVAIINFWDCGELLPYSVRQWHKLGVNVIIVYSNLSNYGARLDNDTFLNSPDYKDCILFHVEPLQGWSPSDNERRKRNKGLDMARQKGFTHFITCDADELYEPFEVDWDAAGTVVKCRTYFKSPQLTIGLDTTLIPFVHKLTPTIAHEFNRAYPYAWIDGGIRIDPTRSLNITSGVVMSDIECHHYSWIRRDYSQKINNSTASSNLKRSTILTDLRHCKERDICQFYNRRLVRATVDFGIPEMAWQTSL